MVGLMRVSAGVNNREDPRLLQLLQPATVAVDAAVSSRAGVGDPGSVSRPSHDASARCQPSTRPVQTELEHLPPRAPQFATRSTGAESSRPNGIVARGPLEERTAASTRTMYGPPILGERSRGSRSQRAS